MQFKYFVAVKMSVLVFLSIKHLSLTYQCGHLDNTHILTCPLVSSVLTGFHCIYTGMSRSNPELANLSFVDISLK